MTVPKITIIEQVEYIVAALTRLERELGFDEGALQFEAMVETPQIILDSSGRTLLPRIFEMSEGRLSAAHFGTYDYTAGINITAAYQRMQHPACEFAKHFMQVAFAGTDVWLSDGSTTVMPVPIHKDETLTGLQREENVAGVHAAWKMHFDDVRHSLAGGFYQGWDLHPAQLVTRYAALYSFFLDGIDAAGVRLSNFVGKAAQATLVGDVFDDAATGQGLLNFFLRGINSGAITEAEALKMTGLTADEFRGRSFVKIMRGQKMTGELVDLVARWIHVIAGIMWVGNSLLFNWLDRNLVKGPRGKGTIWLLHSGGFYFVEKTLLEGEQLPKPLHWFKWQAYTTWLSGMVLLLVIYYLGGRAVLADPTVASLSACPGRGHRTRRDLWRVAALRVDEPVRRAARADHLGDRLDRGADRDLDRADPSAQRPRRLPSRRRDARHDHGRERLLHDRSVATRARRVGREGPERQAGRALGASEARLDPQQLLHLSGDRADGEQSLSVDLWD